MSLKQEKQISWSIYFLLGIVFFLPYLILLQNFKISVDFNWNYFFQALRTSFFQSSVVVGFCLALSLLGFRGLFYYGSHNRALLKNVLIAPMLMPSIYTIIIALALFKPFPFGTWGVILVFLMTYFGYFFVSFTETLESKLGSQYLIKEIYNISTLKFIFKIMLPQLSKDVLNLSVIIFVGCFSSLSVPLIASGGRSANFELFIYETIFIQNDWNSAVILSVIQALILLALGLYANSLSTKSHLMPIKEFNLRSLPSSLLVMSYIAMYFGIFAYHAIPAFIKAPWSTLVAGQLVMSFANSLKLFVTVAALFTAFVVALLYLSYARQSLRFFKLFLTPSSVIVGFALYLFFSVGSEGIDLVKATLGIFIISSFSLFFNFITPQLDQLENQMMVGRIYNIRFFSFFHNILWPQIKNKFFLCVSILLLVCLTDFAIIKAVGAQIETMGTYIYFFLSSYRLQWSFVFSLGVLLIWVFFLGVIKFLFKLKDR